MDLLTEEAGEYGYNIEHDDDDDDEVNKQNTTFSCNWIL